MICMIFLKFCFEGCLLFCLDKGVKISEKKHDVDEHYATFASVLFLKARSLEFFVYRFGLMSQVKHISPADVMGREKGERKGRLKRVSKKAKPGCLAGWCLRKKTKLMVYRVFLLVLLLVVFGFWLNPNDLERPRKHLKSLCFTNDQGWSPGF